MIAFIRNKGKERQGEVLEDTHLVEVHKNGRKYHVLLYTHDKRYIEYECDHFVNALGYSAERFARMLGLYTGLYPVKHQALITHRLPNLGKNGDILEMCIRDSDLSSRQKTLYTLVSYLNYHFLYVTNNPFFLKDNYSL